jgi:hypothetical protein
MYVAHHAIHPCMTSNVGCLFHCLLVVSVEILSSSWSAHFGVMCRGVNWARFSQQQLLDICACVGGLGLAAVLRLMAEDHSGAQGWTSATTTVCDF